MLKAVVLYDYVSEQFSYPVFVKDNVNLLKRDLRDLIVNGSDKELSTNYKDKCALYVGDYDIDEGVLYDLSETSAWSFGDTTVVRSVSLKDHFWLFDLKDLFIEDKAEVKEDAK